MKAGIILLAGIFLFSQPLLAAGEGWHLSTGSASESGSGSNGNYNNRGYDNHRTHGGYEDGSRGYPPEDYNNNGGGTNADVVVDLPPEVWTQGQNNQPPCLRCCTYQNRSYTEGSVVKMEGVLLQCARDERSVGTNNLTWQTVK